MSFPYKHCCPRGLLRGRLLPYELMRTSTTRAYHCFEYEPALLQSRLLTLDPSHFLPEGYHPSQATNSSQRRHCPVDGD